MQIAQAAELGEELTGGSLPHAGNVQKLGSDLALGTPRAVEGNRKPVSLIADLLNQVQCGRVVIEHNRFILPP